MLFKVGNGFKDKEGKFHPTGNDSTKLSSRQVKTSTLKRVNHSDAKALLDSKKPHDKIVSVFDGKSPDEIKKQLDEMYVEKYLPAIPELKGLDGKPLETRYHTNIYAMGSPYMYKTQIGVPKVEKDKWYLTHWDDGLLGIYDRKKDAQSNEEGSWERHGKGVYSIRDATNLTKGDRWNQKDLTEIYGMSVDGTQDGTDDYGKPRAYETPFQEQVATCRGCGGKRGFDDRGKNGHCKSCTKIRNEN